MSKEKKFEENLADLEVIVQKLENGDVALEEAIAEFQKGMKLSKELQASLDKAEKTLVKVMQADGTETEMEFLLDEYSCHQRLSELGLAYPKPEALGCS